MNVTNSAKVAYFYYQVAPLEHNFNPRAIILATDSPEYFKSVSIGPNEL